MYIWWLNKSVIFCFEILSAWWETAKKSFGITYLPHPVKVQLVVLVSAFAMIGTLWSVSCLLLYCWCSPHSPPPFRMESTPLCYPLCFLLSLILFHAAIAETVLPRDPMRSWLCRRPTIDPSWNWCLGSKHRRRFCPVRGVSPPEKCWESIRKILQYGAFLPENISRSAVHNAFLLNTLTTWTPFSCVPAAFQQWNGVPTRPLRSDPWHPDHR